VAKVNANASHDFARSSSFNLKLDPFETLPERVANPALGDEFAVKQPLSTRREGATVSWHRIVVAVLLAAVALETLGQPWPVEVDVGSERPQWGSPFVYRVNVTALRPVDVRVRVNVLTPGRGWSGWIVLWEGQMAAGESRVFRGQSSEPVKLGSYVIWASISFSSPQDYQVIGGYLYHASYDTIHVVTVYEPSAEYWYNMYVQARNESEQWKSKYENISAETAILKANIATLQAELVKIRTERDKLLANYTSLQSEHEAALAEKKRLADENAYLQELALKLESEARAALAAATLLAVLSTALGIALTILIIRCRKALHPTPPPPPD